MVSAILPSTSLFRGAIWHPNINLHVVLFCFARRTVVHLELDMIDGDEKFSKVCGTTLDATKRWERQSSRQRNREGRVEELMSELYFSARVGLAAAEYNLEKAGLIEMIYGHRAGHLGTNGFEQSWCDCRWTLSDRGRRTSMARLERVMLRDPPLAIAEWDAEDEANDIATNFADCDPDDFWLVIHRRISVGLDKRAERVHLRSSLANRPKPIRLKRAPSRSDLD
jgi:hypothetical protein